MFEYLKIKNECFNINFIILSLLIDLKMFLWRRIFKIIIFLYKIKSSVDYATVTGCYCICSTTAVTIWINNCEPSAFSNLNGSSNKIRSIYLTKGNCFWANFLLIALIIAFRIKCMTFRCLWLRSWFWLFFSCIFETWNTTFVWWWIWWWILEVTSWDLFSLTWHLLHCPSCAFNIIITSFFTGIWVFGSERKATQITASSIIVHFKAISFEFELGLDSRKESGIRYYITQFVFQKTNWIGFDCSWLGKHPSYTLRFSVTQILA